MEVALGEAYDDRLFCSLVAPDREQKIPVETYSADGNHHFYLEYHKLYAVVCLKDIRTKKKDANKPIGLGMVQTSTFKAGRKKRCKTERKFGEAEQGHGLRCCRYLGLLRFGMQLFVTVMALNLANWCGSSLFFVGTVQRFHLIYIYMTIARCYCLLVNKN
ncbi:MAG: hypothetical protein GX142_06465 [Chloroflexi bacterium]|nr:hypothetical protein [Chloroflexota bacterium]